MTGRHLRWSAVVVAAAALVGCSSDLPTPTPTTVPWPAELSACEPAPIADEATCVQQIADALRQDTIDAAVDGPITHAALSRGASRTFERLEQTPLEISFARVTPSTDGDEELTTPVETTWSIGTVSATLWVCFDGGTVEVGTAACG